MRLRSTFLQFVEGKGLHLKTVLAYSPMSNGKAERMAGTMKRSISKIMSDNKLD